MEATRTEPAEVTSVGKAIHFGTVATIKGRHADESRRHCPCLDPDLNVDAIVAPLGLSGAYTVRLVNDDSARVKVPLEFTMLLTATTTALHIAHQAQIERARVQHEKLSKLCIYRAQECDGRIIELQVFI